MGWTKLHEKQWRMFLKIELEIEVEHSLIARQVIREQKTSYSEIFDRQVWWRTKYHNNNPSQRLYEEFELLPSDKRYKILRDRHSRLKQYCAREAFNYREYNFLFIFYQAFLKSASALNVILNIYLVAFVFCLLCMQAFSCFFSIFPYRVIWQENIDSDWQSEKIPSFPFTNGKGDILVSLWVVTMVDCYNVAQDKQTPFKGWYSKTCSPLLINLLYMKNVWLRLMKQWEWCNTGNIELCFKCLSLPTGKKRGYWLDLRFGR